MVFRVEKKWRADDTFPITGVGMFRGPIIINLEIGCYCFVEKNTLD